MLRKSTNARNLLNNKLKYTSAALALGMLNGCGEKILSQNNGSTNEAEITKLKSEKVELEHKLKEIQAKIKNSDKPVEDSLEEITKLKNELKSKTTEINNKETNLNKALDEKGILATKNSELNSTITLNNQTIEELKKNNTQLSELMNQTGDVKISELNKLRQEKETEVTNLKSEKAELENKLKELEQKNKNREQTTEASLQKLETRISNLEGEILNIKQNINELIQKVAAANTNNGAANSYLPPPPPLNLNLPPPPPLNLSNLPAPPPAINLPTTSSLSTTQLNGPSGSSQNTGNNGNNAGQSRPEDQKPNNALHDLKIKDVGKLREELSESLKKSTENTDDINVNLANAKEILKNLEKSTEESGNLYRDLHSCFMFVMNSINTLYSLSKDKVNSKDKEELVKSLTNLSDRIITIATQKKIDVSQWSIPSLGIYTSRTFNSNCYKKMYICPNSETYPSDYKRFMILSKIDNLGSSFYKETKKYKEITQSFQKDDKRYEAVNSAYEYAVDVLVLYCAKSLGFITDTDLKEPYKNITAFNLIYTKAFICMSAGINEDEMTKKFIDCPDFSYGGSFKKQDKTDLKILSNPEDKKKLGFAVVNCLDDLAKGYLDISNNNCQFIDKTDIEKDFDQMVYQDLDTLNEHLGLYFGNMDINKFNTTVGFNFASANCITNEYNTILKDMDNSTNSENTKKTRKERQDKIKKRRGVEIANEPAREMTFMEALTAKINRRYKFLNMEKELSDED